MIPLCCFVWFYRKWIADFVRTALNYYFSRLLLFFLACRLLIYPLAHFKWWMKSVERVRLVSVEVDKTSMSYSWYNICSGYHNTVRYSHDFALSWTSITFRDGNYSYDELKQHYTLNSSDHRLDTAAIKVQFIPALFN